MIAAKWLAVGADLADAYAIRRAVFVQEQGVAEAEEYDGTDADARHVVIYEDATPVATGRILVTEGVCQLGRVCTLKEKRGRGYGDLAMRMLIRKAYAMGYPTQYIHAQTHARGFYEKLGFTAYGDLFWEAGIEHVSMAHEGDIAGEC